MGKEFHQSVNQAKYGLIMMIVFLLIVSYRYYQSLVTLNVKMLELEQTSAEYESCQMSEKNLREASSKCAKEAEESKAKIDDLNKKLDEMMQQLSNKDSEKEGLISELETLKNQIEEQKKATELSKQPVQAQPAPQADVPQQPAGGGGAVQPEAKPQPAETQVEQPAPPKEHLAEAV